MKISEDCKERLIKAAAAIKTSQHLVIFTGAGMSTESGIPDYRGPQGVWTLKAQGKKPKQSVSWDRIKPNAGHYALVELQNLGLMKFLISQNVDGLHLISGIKPELIAEFHGNHNLMRCLSCNRQFPKKGLWDENKWGKGYRTSPILPEQPKCPHCNGRIISSVVNFGDPIPEKELELSLYHSGHADVFVAIGSSLTVTPAAEIPLRAKKHGALLIIINEMETGLDHQADIRFYEGAGFVLTTILSLIKQV